MGKNGKNGHQANEMILNKIIKEIAESVESVESAKSTKPHLYDFARVVSEIGGGRIRVRMCEDRAEIVVLIRGTLRETKRSPARLYRGSAVIIYDRAEVFARIPESTPGDRIVIRALITRGIYPKSLLVNITGDDDDNPKDDSAGGFEFRHEEMDAEGGMGGMDDKYIKKYMGSLLPISCDKSKTFRGARGAGAGGAGAGAGAEAEPEPEAELTEADIMAI